MIQLLMKKKREEEIEMEMKMMMKMKKKRTMDKQKIKRKVNRIPRILKEHLFLKKIKEISNKISRIKISQIRNKENQ